MKKVIILITSAFIIVLLASCCHNTEKNHAKLIPSCKIHSWDNLISLESGDVLIFTHENDNIYIFDANKTECRPYSKHKLKVKDIYKISDNKILITTYSYANYIYNPQKDSLRAIDCNLGYVDILQLDDHKFFLQQYKKSSQILDIKSGLCKPINQINNDKELLKVLKLQDSKILMISYNYMDSEDYTKRGAVFKFDAQIYDPETNKSISITCDNLTTVDNRYYHLKNGDIFIWGRVHLLSRKKHTLYDHKTKTFKNIKLPFKKNSEDEEFFPVQLKDGNLFIIGKDYCYIYDPISNTVLKKIERFSAFNSTGSLLKNGNIFLNFNEIYDFKENRFYKVSVLNHYGEAPEKFKLKDGRILYYGGWKYLISDSPNNNKVSIYKPER